MNELEIKSSWLKMQINSCYGLSQSSNRKLMDDYTEINNRIRDIKLRKSKIKKIWKTDGIV